MSNVKGMRLFSTILLFMILGVSGVWGQTASFRLFSPLKYYPNITKDIMNRDSAEQTLEDRILMDMYIKHPELVEKDIDTGTSAGIGISPETPPSLSLTDTTKFLPVPTRVPLNAPTEPVNLFVTKPHFWTFIGDYYLQFMQNHVSDNWYQSGNKSYSMLGTVTLQYNYDNARKLKFNNKLEMRLGLQTSNADTINKFKTSEDLIRYTGKLDRQAHKQWYYALQLLAYTQFSKGLKDNDKKVYSDFMSPFTLNVSLGMDYFVETKNKRLKGTIHLAPIAFNFKYVDRKDLAAANGITTDHHTMEDFGSQTTVDLEWNPIDNFSWRTRFYAYTTYHKLLIEWENNISFRFNRFLSTNLFLYPRFDDSVKPIEPGHTLLQFKEYFSLGFSYSM